MSGKFEKRTSSLELPDEMTFVMRQKLGHYVLKKIPGLSSAKVENFGARGNVLTVSPSVHPLQLETTVYAFQADYRDGYVR